MKLKAAKGKQREGELQAETTPKSQVFITITQQNIGVLYTKWGNLSPLRNDTDDERARRQETDRQRNVHKVVFP